MPIVSFTNWTVADIPVEHWILALLVTIIIYLVISQSLNFLARRLATYAESTDGRIDDIIFDVVSHTNRLLIFLAAALIGLGLLDLPLKWESRIPIGWTIVLGIQLALWINRGISRWLRGYPASASRSTMTFILRFLVWVTVVLSILANLGINITAFVASLGIGGVAIALAVQNILSDLFASLSIALDKPFETGDFIISGDMLGTVEYIGVKTTRIRSLSGEQVVISNAELLRRTIRNYKRMNERRAVFNFSVTYQTPVDQVQALPGILKQIIESTENTRFDRAHFAKFGADALEFEVVYYVLASDYNLYMDIQQQINLELMRACEQRSIEFAFPTRTLHIASVPPSAEQFMQQREGAARREQPG